MGEGRETKRVETKRVETERRRPAGSGPVARVGARHPATGKARKGTSATSPEQGKYITQAFLILQRHLPALTAGSAMPNLRAVLPGTLRRPLRQVAPLQLVGTGSLLVRPAARRNAIGAWEERLGRVSLG